MALDVAYRGGSGQLAVGYFNAAAQVGPAIDGVPSVQDGQAITITGTNFSASGNAVYLGDIEVSIDTESTTEIVTDAVDVSFLPMATPALLKVIDSGDIESAPVEVTIQPQSGHGVFAITGVQLGDPTFRLSSEPDLELGDEIETRNAQGTNVTIDDVNIDARAGADVRSDSDDDPNVNSFEFRVFDGAERSSTWATVNWAGVSASTGQVPDVVGETQEDAESLIEAEGLVLGIVIEAYSPTEAAGIVIAQFPSADTTVLLGSSVEITVSLGPAPNVVPDLSGLTTSECSDALEAAGLALGNVNRYIDGNNTGLVIGQAIAQGTVLDSGATVDVVISTNQVPDVVGLLLLDAVNTIAAANLTVNEVTEREFATGTAAGIVLEQTPAADATANPGDSVSMVVSRAFIGGGAFVGPLCFLNRPH